MKVSFQHYNYPNKMNYGYNSPCFQARRIASPKIEMPEKAFSKAIAALGAAFLAISSKKKKEEQVLEVTLENDSFMKSQEAFVTFLSQNPKVDKNDFYRYVNSINLESLKEKAPLLNEYSKEQLEFFITNHYLLGTKDFNEESLKLPCDLTKMISEKPFDLELYDVLLLFPNTDRYVGNIPEGWVEGSTLEPEELRRRVFKLLDEFISTKRVGVDSGWMLQDKLRMDLGEILQKKVGVIYLGGGNSADAYKISVEGCSPKVLKRYHHFVYRQNSNGQWGEVPIAFFVNRYEDRFVHTYLGKLPNQARDVDGEGYLLTEYVNANNRSNVESVFKDKKYKIRCNDIINGYNTGDGKIYDHGCTEITPRTLFQKKFNLIKFVKGLHETND